MKTGIKSLKKPACQKNPKILFFRRLFSKNVKYCGQLIGIFAPPGAPFLSHKLNNLVRQQHLTSWNGLLRMIVSNNFYLSVSEKMWSHTAVMKKFLQQKT